MSGSGWGKEKWNVRRGRRMYEGGVIGDRRMKGGQWEGKGLLKNCEVLFWCSGVSYVHCTDTIVYV